MNTAATSPAPETETPPLILQQVSDKIATLTLNRARQQNTLTLEMMSALIDTLQEIGKDDQVHVIVIRAEGPSFCAGHNLKEMQGARGDKDGGEAFFRNLFQTCTSLMNTISDLPVPVIASIQGMAVAAGCQLVATCDLAVASSASKFGVNGINVGFFCSTPAVPLARNISKKKAMELLITGRLIGAQEAQLEGLINLVVEPDELEKVTNEFAEVIASKSRKVIELGKKTFNKQVQMNVEDAYTLASVTMVENLLLEDNIEGISAFIEKRSPNWKNT